MRLFSSGDRPFWWPLLSPDLHFILALPVRRPAACPDGEAAWALLVEAGACVRELQELPRS